MFVESMCDQCLNIAVSLRVSCYSFSEGGISAWESLLKNLLATLVLQSVALYTYKKVKS